MAPQLPPEAVGAAAGVLIYSLICLTSGLFLLWMVWVHDERKSYVAMLGFFTSLHTIASVIQQAHTIARWTDVKTDQHANLVANVGDPELNITGCSTGLDLVLFYIQYYAYNVESMLVLFWAFELADSIYQLRPHKVYRFHLSLIAKATAALLPALQVILLHFSGVNKSTIGFMALADAIMVFCFAAGGFMLLAILIRYVHSRLTLASWNVRYGQRSGVAHSAPLSASDIAPARPLKRTIYDKWLVLRFSVAFAALSLFQIIVVNFQLRAAATNTTSHIPPQPDLSPSRAASDFALFAPAPTAVLFVFVVFGTTRTFREYMWTLFVPRCLRARVEDRARRRREHGASVSVVHSASRGGDVEAGNGGVVVMVGLREVGRRGDEWPILRGGVEMGVGGKG
ncbi:hypothetical protein C8A05DRAFT_17328 [Staphylotrichum tortipilum]|uniref:Uncharacterized protein n=1 Tax=Staphylotrichum tortipilum TaxID=2831512 RepID=A0AAN6MHS7_9PEZI|nr:hypothetical protein C8A05DRAFT_17328 [Staphylotrichum longicolle]